MKGEIDNDRVVTPSMSNIDFIKCPRGDIIEIGMEVVKLGKTSITVPRDVSNKRTEQTITSVDSIVFVNLGPDLINIHPWKK